MGSSFLRNRILSNALEQGSKLASDLVNYLSFQPSADLSERIRDFFGLQGQGLMQLAENDELVDWRLRILLLKGIRLLGSPKNHDGGDAWYGLSALDCHEGKDQPVRSLFLLGKNGSGKSTLFNAAEWLLCKKIGEAEYRGYDDLDKFLANAHEGAKIRYRHAKGEYTYGYGQNTAELNANLSSFFLSENSLQRLSKSIGKDDNWFGFFCECLNIRDLFDFSEGGKLYEEIMSALESEQDEKEQTSADILKNLQKEITALSRRSADLNLNEMLNQKLAELKEIYDEWCAEEFTPSDINQELSRVKVPNLSNHPLIAQRWKGATTRIKNAYAQKKTPAAQTAGSVFRSAEQADGTLPAVAEMRTALKRLISDIEAVVNAMWKDAELLKLSDDIADYIKAKAKEGIVAARNQEKAEELKKGLEDLREKLSGHIRREVKNLADDLLKEMVADVFGKTFLEKEEELVLDTTDIDSGRISIKVNEIHVSKYFNTFRFRLFFIALQTAICLKMMKTGNFLFPIFIDDIFYANDYRNKHELYKFFEVVFSTAGEQLGRDKLQVIFFSHDEQFMTALHSSMNKKRLEKALFGRILKPAEAETLARCEMKTPDGQETFINLYLRMYENAL